MMDGWPQANDVKNLLVGRRVERRGRGEESKNWKKMREKRVLEVFKPPSNDRRYQPTTWRNLKGRASGRTASPARIWRPFFQIWTAANSRAPFGALFQYFFFFLAAGFFQPPLVIFFSKVLFFCYILSLWRFFRVIVAHS